MISAHLKNTGKRKSMKDRARPKRAVIVGSGSIGRRHAECLKMIYPEVETVLLRHKPKSQSNELDQPNCFDRIVHSVEEAAVLNCDAAIVATPAPYHCEVAKKLAATGLRLLVEKPMSNNVEEAIKFFNFCHDRDVLLRIGYVLRCNSCLQKFRTILRSGIIGSILSFRVEVGHYLPDWRPGQNYLESVSAIGSLGGGALLELSHELDYIRWVFGEVNSVQSIVTNSNTLGVDVEDMVASLIEVKNFDERIIHGSLSLDMLQRAPRRFCSVIGTEATLDCDLINNVVTLLDKEHPQGLRVFEQQNPDRNEMYKEQLERFFATDDEAETVLASGRDGVSVLHLVDAIKLSSSSGKKLFIGQHVE